MKIIDQSHEILHITPNLLQMIEVAGRTCYKSEDKIGCTGLLCDVKDPVAECGRILTRTFDNCDQTDCKYHSSHKFVQMLIKKGHEAMLEFGDITVKFITNRAMTHELVRHRLCSFAQTSQRYVRYDNIEFIRPVWLPTTYTDTTFTLSDITKCNPDIPDPVFIMACINAESKYNQLLKLGWRPEQARDVLPNATKTEIVMKANAREIRYLLNLRCSKHAHPQMRDLMLPLLKELHEKIPVLFDDLYNNYFEEKNND